MSLVAWAPRCRDGVCSDEWVAVGTTLDGADFTLLRLWVVSGYVLPVGMGSLDGL